MNIAQHVSVYSQALNLRTQRHQALASNIANADTPHYLARDFDFAEAMQQAMGGQMSGGLELRRTATAHLAGGGNGGAANLQYRQVVQGAVDGNTVDMDVERAAIGENAMQYQILTQLIGDKFRGLRNAMTSANS
ncbi:MAG: flagellar basal body rod protein FlgB [Azonexus sp.]|jgi:flagellar basal-body rod protein FlgB|nr:flagellar basal body rod protein FlgB [Azonexus sp.]